MFVRRILAALTAALCFALVAPGTASAEGAAQSTAVTTRVAATTPNVLDGTVFAIAQVGSTVVLGGDFTGAANPGSQSSVTDPDRGRYVVAFDASTGQVRTAFAPNLDGQVRAVLPGPTASTVYVGGYFNNVDGVRAKGVVLLDLATGQRVPSFRAIPMNGVVTSLDRVGNRLYVGGTFTTFAGQARGGLASVNATTGVEDGFLQSRVLTNHNWTEGSTDARAAVGVFGLDITPDGNRMIVIGNFKTVDGLPNDQIAMFDLSGAQATVRADWRARGYEARCYAWAYDTYVRDVEFSPDGSYFVVVTTGGGNTTLCDTAARFETAGSGDDVQPTWVDWSGGDSYLSVAVTGSTVYVGGHQRWMNNRLGNDAARGGAVPRPGLGALDPNTGIPLSWNPGRNPRGAGAYALLATANGLYVGSDTDWIGNFEARRMKIAYFPLAGGAPAVDTTLPDLPGTVYSGAPAGTESASPVLHRVNAGGSSVPATDDGPAWASDSSSTSSVRTSGSNRTTGVSVDRVDSTVPAGTPATIFTTERWDPGTATDGKEMRWFFTVPAGLQVTVRLYFANTCTCTNTAGSRVFDVTVDGATVLDDFDIVAQAGDRTGTMRDVTITSDGTVDIQFGHIVENPLINGIEIIDTAKAAEPTTTPPLVARDYDGATVSPAQTIPSDLDWSRVRAPVYLGRTLFYGKSDGMFYKRSFTGTSFGPEQAIDPYNDPRWNDVNTGSNSTYRGMRPSLYGFLPYLDAMFYSDGRLYFVSSLQPGLYYTPFSPESGIAGHTITQVPGVALGAVDGAFVSGTSLYYVQASTGDLLQRAWTPGTPAVPGTVGTTAALVSGPTRDGVDWRARSTFLGPDGPGVNQLPTAAMTATCTGLACTFSASGSSDPDGTVTGYAWDFGGEGTGDAATESFTFDEAGTYPVRLTVTDDRGGTGVITESVTVQVVTNPPPTAEASVSCEGLLCSFDASGSSDDGAIASYEWTFGDGTTGTGRTTTHRYATAGSYAAVLTVTDDAGARSSREISVSPTPPAAGGVGFRGVSGTNVLGTSATVSVPDAVQAGDLLVLAVAGAGGSAHTPPAGWDQVAAVNPSGVLTTVWQRSAAAGDAGDDVRVTFGASQKADVSLVAYSGAATIASSAVGTATDAFAAGSHRQPTVTAAQPGSRALWFWNVKSSATTDITVPAGTVSRNFAPGSGTGRMTSLVAESAATVSGSVPGPVAVADGVAMGRTTMVALVVAPSGAGSPAPNQLPTAEAAASCVGMTCSFDAAGSSDPDGSIASYAWDFGDGTSSTQRATSHTYTTARDHLVTLTVTDDRGGATTREVTVSPAAPAAGGIAFRGVSRTSVLGSSATVTVPADVRAGDLLLLNVAGAGASPQTPPAGWSTVAAVNPSGVLTTVFQRTAVAGDAGAQVRVTFGASQKADVALLAYAGAAPVDPAAAVTKTDPTSAGAHTMPDVTVTRPDSVLLWFWNVKSSATTDLSVPAGTVSRNSSAGSGTGYLTTLVAEQAVATPGTVAGPTSTADGVSTGRTTMVGLVISSGA